MSEKVDYELYKAIGQNVPQISSTCWLGDQIPEKKLQAAINAYATGVNPAQVLAMIDTTVLGSCKEGILFTTSGMYVSIQYDAHFSCRYEDIVGVNVLVDSKQKSNDSVKDSKKTLIIRFEDGRSERIKWGAINKTPFKNLLSRTIQLKGSDHFSKNDKYVIIEDVDADTKLAYISVVTAFASLVKPINAQQLNRLYALMVRIKTNSEIRKVVLQQLGKEFDIDNLLEIINSSAQGSPSALKAVYVSIVKDILAVSGVLYEQFNEKENAFIDKISACAGLGSKEIRLIQESITKEQAYLSGTISEKEYMAAVSGIAASAAALGIPVVALYLSGSVVGLSAAGITSGLAALGLGGILGLGSMVTGVGVLVVLGMTAHWGVKKISGTGKERSSNQRDILLKAALKANENVISVLISDLSFLTDELIELADQNEVNAANVRELNAKLSILKMAFERSAEVRQETESSISKINEGNQK